MRSALAQRSVTTQTASGVRVAGRSRAVCVAPKALFGWGKKDGEKSERELEKEEQFRLQQELRAKRRTGELIDTANVRRAKVKETMAEKKAARKSERDQLAKGIMPESLKNWKNYKNKIDEKGTEGLVVPLLPFGLKEFDEGERFDLRSPYSDDGWIEEDELNMWDSFKKFNQKFLNFRGRAAVEEEAEKYRGKPIQWASTFGKKPKDQK